MSRNTGRDGIGRRYRKILATVAASLTLGALATACGPDEKKPEDTGSSGMDVESDVDAGMMDASDTVAVDTSADTATDAGEDTTADSTSDSGSDGDADAGSSCEIDEVDTERDRDRDGLRDDCDNFPYLNHGGDNPESARIIEEKEGQISNDNANEGESYDIQLPLMIDGEVGPVEDDGDLDYYSFEIDEPTAILLKIEAKTDMIWPGGVMLGYDTRNANYQPVLLGSETGQDSEREMYLPVPGKYSLAVSDVRNLLPDTNAADVPESGSLPYRVHISKVPLPKLESTSLPDTATHTYKQRLHAYEIDTTGANALEVTAQGIGMGQNSFHSPGIHVVDPSTGRTLAFTIGQQVDTDTRKVTLKAPLAQKWDKVLVVEDNISRFGNSSVKLDFAETTVDSEFETIQETQDERASDLVWLQPGMTIDGEIGPPRMASSTSLSPDIDYYLLSARRGMGVEVTVRPTGNSQLQPRMIMGNFLARAGGTSTFFNSNGHEVPAAEMAGESRSIKFFFNSGSDGEVAFQVRHAPNDGSSNPVGGSSYGYEIEVAEWTPMPEEISMLPGSAKVSFEPGGMGFVEFDAQQGDIIRVTSEEPEGVSIFERSRITKTMTWEGDLEQSGTFEFLAPTQGTYWYDIRSFRGSGTDGKDMTINVEKASTQELKSLPATVNGMLDSGDDADYYKLAVQKGDRLDFRVSSQSFTGRIDVLELPSFNRIEIAFRDEVTRIEEDGFIVIKVSPSGSSGGSYTLGVQEIAPMDIGGVPISQSGTIDNAPFPVWYKMSVTKGDSYLVDFAESGMTNYQGRIEVFDPNTMQRVESSSGGKMRFVANWDGGEAYIAVFDDDQRGDPGYGFDVSVEKLSINPVTLGQTTSGQLASGQDEAIYTFSAPPGAVDAVVESTGAWTPRVRLLEASDLDEVNGPEYSRGVARYAGSQMNEYALLVQARDGGRMGTLQFDLTVQVDDFNNTTSESEPNDMAGQAQSLTTLPAAIEGELGKSGDADDYYSVNLQAGQRVWALAVPKDPNNRFRMRPKLELIRPNGMVLTDDRYDGEGSFPSLYAERVDESGTWTIRVQRQQTSQSGIYYLYVYTSDTFTAMESEPNDSQAAAQSLGTIDAPAKIAATVDGSDPTDVYTFDLKRDLDSVRIFLEGATAGHDVRLLDAMYNEVEASGPNHDGKSQPDISTQNVQAGTYFLEVKQGNGGGSMDIIMWQEP